MFGLSSKTTAQIYSVFEKHPAIEKAVLYGSRAKGNFREGSDIDITLFGKNLSISELGTIFDELDDLLLPYTFDLSLYDNIENESLKEHIKRVGKIFYEKK